MPWISTIAPESADGLLKRIYTAATKRAGKVYRVLRVQSLQPQVLHSSTQLYTRLMMSPAEPLQRWQREAIATVVSRLNGCEY